MKRDLPILPALLDVIRIVQAPHSPSDAFVVLDDALAKVPGRSLTTILLVDNDAGLARRVFSSRPDVFPTGGTKPTAAAPRLRTVVETGQPFVGHQRADIVANYPDAESLFSLDCESVINCPVLWQGAVVATVNVFNGAGFYDVSDVATVQCLAHSILPGILDAAAVLSRQPDLHQA